MRRDQMRTLKRQKQESKKTLTPLSLHTKKNSFTHETKLFQFQKATPLLFILSSHDSSHDAVEMKHTGLSSSSRLDISLERHMRARRLVPALLYRTRGSVLPSCGHPPWHGSAESLSNTDDDEYQVSEHIRSLSAESARSSG